MSSARLQQQFIRLWQCCEGRSQETTLNELAEMLSCSRRHMRTLLNMMEERGWLTWEAEAGRGKRSSWLSSTPAWRCSSSGRKICWSRIASISWCSWSAIRPPCDRCWSPTSDGAFARAAYFARALLPADEKSAPRQRAAPFGKPYRPANLQRPDAGK